MQGNQGVPAAPSGLRSFGPEPTTQSQPKAPVPNAAREKSAFMAGWLTRHHRFDVQPEEAWLTYLDSQEGVRK